MTYKQYYNKIKLHPRFEELTEKYNNDNRYHYVYRITFQNEHYYGSRTSKVQPIQDLGKRYFTSGKLQKHFAKNISLYKTKIIKVFSNSFDKMVYESYLHQKFNVKKHQSFANKSNQTPYGFDTTGILNTQEQKKKNSLVNSGKNNSFYNKKHSAETRKKMKTAKAFGVHQPTKKTKTKMSAKKKNISTGPFTDERKIKLSKARTGKKWYVSSNGQHSVFVSNIVAPCYTLFGYKLGRCIGKLDTIKCPYCDKVGAKSGMKRYHFDNCKMKVIKW